jgi:transcriptional regulator with XRE-family HTH domain
MEAQEIKTLRNKLGLSQRQFAKRLGVKRQTVACWESGIRTPSLKITNELKGWSTKVEASVDSQQNVDKENVDSEVVDKENVDKKVVDSEIVDREVVLSKSVLRENVDKEAENVDSDCADNNNVDKESVLSKVVDNGVVDNPSVSNQESDMPPNSNESKLGTILSDGSSQTKQNASPPPVVIVGDKLTYNENPKRKTTKRRSPFVQSVLDQIPIEGEIGKDVQLRQSSKKFSGLCPFHNDTHFCLPLCRC